MMVRGKISTKILYASEIPRTSSLSLSLPLLINVLNKQYSRHFHAPSRFHPLFLSFSAFMALCIGSCFKKSFAICGFTCGRAFERSQFERFYFIDIAKDEASVFALFKGLYFIGKEKQDIIFSTK